MMNQIFKKLNFKGHSPVHVLYPPDSFQHNLEELRTEVKVKNSLSQGEMISFVLAFVTRQKEVDELATRIAAGTHGDAIVWFAYPKATSKRFKCDFNRDTGWQTLGDLGFEGVRMVAIDEDWSALRFRRAEHIRKMTRSFAMSKEGKVKTSGGEKKRT